MAGKFTALALPSGEAFLLETHHNGRDVAILVDSGNVAKDDPLVAAVRKASPNRRRIDIAVCTHQDSDHAKGFSSFADAWYSEGGEIGEYWLPGRWAAAVPAILLDPGATQARVFLGALQISSDLDPFLANGEADHASLEEVVRKYALQNGRFEEPNFAEESVLEAGAEQRNPDLAQSLGLTEGQIASLAAILDDREPGWCEGAFNIFTGWPLWRDGVVSRAMILARDAIETAKSIYAIAESAAVYKIPIRWFDFGPFEVSKSASGGIRGLLEPVSSVELRRPPSRVSDIVLFLSLYLSRQNVESLVFYRPETAEEPGVLFTGDSRLAFGIGSPGQPFPMPTTVPRRQIIGTAPHHGSRVNDVVYGIIGSWIGQGNNAFYIRNGGHWKQSLGDYLKQPYRACVKCKGRHPKPRRVSVKSVGGVWKTARLPKCVCRQ